MGLQNDLHFLKRNLRVGREEAKGTESIYTKNYALFFSFYQFLKAQSNYFMLCDVFRNEVNSHKAKNIDIFNLVSQITYILGGMKN